MRQLRLRDIGGIIVIDFIDMVLESNRDLVVRRLVECLGRDRTKHQVAEITSLGLVQMTRKRIGQGLLETFSEPCEHCNGQGVRVQTEPGRLASAPAPGPIPGAPVKGRRVRRRRSASRSAPQESASRRVRPAEWAVTGHQGRVAGQVVIAYPLGCACNARSSPCQRAGGSS